MQSLLKLACGAMAGILLTMLSVQVEALTLGPGDMIIDGSISGPSNCEPDCIPASGSDAFELLYKKDVDEGLESGGFAGSYETEFDSSPDDPADAYIRYVGGPAISCGVCWLVVKDGSHEPYYYFYDLGAAGWNGTDTIELLGFWPDGGAISHVSIWGRPGTNVPEPGTLGLIGLGLAGLGFATRRRRS